MYRCIGGMSSPRRHTALLAVTQLLAFTYAGPLGPLTNITSADLGVKEGSCAVGDVVYLVGDEFPGSSACERCACTARGVQCAPLQCEPRPGCKALHRPDQCCPTYQCECEQEGRVYGNGEKLVDPQDPCRVCYCQGGEVVCRRIACFLRDDCTPRLVPGRCCPEYDNCPLRGVTALPGMTPSSPASTAELLGISAAQPTIKEVKNQEITIKEITPVSEIPIITDVKIKEILPSPSIEVAEYSSSKSPLIPREATSEKPSNVEPEPTKTSSTAASSPEVPSVIEVHPSETVAPEIIKSTDENKAVDDAPPSKISLSTQDSINSEIYPSNVPMVATTAPVVSSSEVTSTTKAPMIEEEDPSLFDHNPAFPPLPDDLSVLSNHGDEIVPEPSADPDRGPSDYTATPEVLTASFSPSTEHSTVKDISTTTHNFNTESSFQTTEKSIDTTFESTTQKPETTTSNVPSRKEIPVINLRSAIPTELLNPSPEITTTEASQNEALKDNVVTTTTERMPDETTKENVKSVELDLSTTYSDEDIYVSTKSATEKILTTTEKATTTQSTQYTSEYTAQDQTTSSIAKSNVPTEVTSQTELSSLPIETSDQNPHDASEKSLKESMDVSTMDPLTTIDRISSPSSEVITVSKTSENGASDNLETTEFVLTSLGSSESSTDAVELIKIAGDSVETSNHAAIIDNTDKNKYALRDFIKLVSDVASINDKQAAEATAAPRATAGISDSEELIPVNAGYKSKANYNQNSITEIPYKIKSPSPANKQRVVEIEDDEELAVTDSLPPNDKTEPTTRRPIIDNVSDDNMPDAKTDKKDIEIITQSYVPTMVKKPSKVMLKEDRSADMPLEDAPAASAASATSATSASVESGAEGAEATTGAGSLETATEPPATDAPADQ